MLGAVFMERELLIEKRKLLLEDIVFMSSRMIKDHDSLDVNGMTEIATRWIKILDRLMHNLDVIDGKITDTRI